MEKLTEKERVFARAIVDGKTQYEAYCIAYDTNTDRRATVDCNASIVANKPHVKEFIARERERKEKALEYVEIDDKQKRINLIWERIAYCQETGNDAAIARYLDMLAKMNGDYINITKDITDDKPLANMSTADLQALLSKDTA